MNRVITDTAVPSFEQAPNPGANPSFDAQTGIDPVLAPFLQPQPNRGLNVYNSAELKDMGISQLSSILGEKPDFTSNAKAYQKRAFNQQIQNTVAEHFPLKRNIGTVFLDITPTHTKDRTRKNDSRDASKIEKIPSTTEPETTIPQAREFIDPEIADHVAGVLKDVFPADDEFTETEIIRDDVQTLPDAKDEDLTDVLTRISGINKDETETGHSATVIPIETRKSKEKNPRTRSLLRNIALVALAAAGVIGGVRGFISLTSDKSSNDQSAETSPSPNTIEETTVPETSEHTIPVITSVETTEVPATTASLPMTAVAPESTQAPAPSASESTTTSASTSTTSTTSTTLPAVTTTEAPPPYSYLQALEKGEITMKETATHYYASLDIPRICLEGVDVYGSNKSSPEDTAMLDALQAAGQLTPEERQLFVTGRGSYQFEADIYQRFNPVYWVAPAEIPQQDCGTDFKSSYTERWNRTPKGSSAAKELARERQTVGTIEPVVDIDWRGVVPGQEGNVVVSGHRTTESGPFANLDALETGDRIIIHGDNGEDYTYAVESMEFVGSTELDYVLNYQSPSGNPETLSLYTCDEDLRLVVRAVRLTV